MLGQTFGMWDLRASANGNQVKLVGEGICGPTTATISADALDARIENAAGFAHHRKKEFAKAATGFAKALALDPSFGISATNLASAQVLAGNHKAAEATLKIELARRPIETMYKIFVDPELEPITRAQSVTRIGTLAKGSAALDRRGRRPTCRRV